MVTHFIRLTKSDFFIVCSVASNIFRQIQISILTDLYSLIAETLYTVDAVLHFKWTTAIHATNFFEAVPPDVNPLYVSC